LYACVEGGEPRFWITTSAQPTTSLHGHETSDKETGYLASPSYCCRELWSTEVKYTVDNIIPALEHNDRVINLRRLEPSPESENVVVVMQEPFPMLTFLSLTLQ
jgi:hypothetical protein